MGRMSSFPTLLDGVKQIDIKNLQKWGYLNTIKQGSIDWSRNGEVISSISIISNIGSVVLSYNWRDEPFKYQVNVESKPSNLGKGDIWYFVCPKTQRLCRKLYFVNGQFLHREAFQGMFYESQIQSKKQRFIEKRYGDHFRLDDLYCESSKKHSKKTYGGKPTKRYLKLKTRIEKGESIPLKEIERVMTFGV